MVRLPMCRICLVENVRMYVVLNKNLHELYEKLTDIPFVTEDSRPLLACFVCCAELKKCYRLQTKCLEAEERFAQIINGNYEPKPLIDENHLEIYHGFINSPIQSMNIVDVGQNESMTVKEELPTDLQRLEDIIEPKEEHLSDDGLEAKNLYDNYLDIYIPPHHSELDSEDDVPLMVFKTEAEEEQEVLENKQKAKKTKRVPIAKKPKIVTRRTKLEVTITPEIKKAASEIIQITKNRMSTRFTHTKPRVINRINNIALDTNPTNSDQDFKPFQCDTCHSSFRYKSVLIKHIRVHTGEKPHKCDVCQRSYSLKGDLTRHIRRHTGAKPHMCDVCQRSFSLKSDLNRHIWIHSGAKPHMCDVCQRSFSLKSDLNRHIRIHTGAKPHMCNVCQRSFSLKKNLRSHILIHTGEKPYKCNVCQRSFRHNFALTEHIKIHTT